MKPSDVLFACPRCAGPVVERRAGEYSVFPCGACGGVWVDNAVSQRLVRSYEHNAVFAAQEASRFAARPVDTRAALACPACGATLHRVLVGGVEIDACAEHGTWFDRDELPHVVGALTRPPEPLALRTEENTVTENLSNAGCGLLDTFLDWIANAETSPNRSWDDDRDAKGGGWFGSSESTSSDHQSTGTEAASPDNCCNSNDNDNYCGDNDSNSCSDNDGGGGHHH